MNSETIAVTAWTPEHEARLRAEIELTSGPYHMTLRHALEAALAEIERLEAELEGSEARVEKAEQERDKALAALKISESSQDVREAIHDEVSACEELEDLRAQFAAAEQERGRLRREIAQRVRAEAEDYRLRALADEIERGEP